MSARARGERPRECLEVSLSLFGPLNSSRAAHGKVHADVYVLFIYIYIYCSLLVTGRSELERVRELRFFFFIASVGDGFYAHSFRFFLLLHPLTAELLLEILQLDEFYGIS